MKIHYGFDSNIDTINAVVTIGSFDGVHRGHRYLIDLMSETAREISGQTVLLTFDPHPREVIHPDLIHRKLSTLDEKLLLLSETGIDHVVVIPFTREFSQIAPEDFVQDYLIDKLHTKVFFAGEGHFFGKNKGGSAAMLRDFSIDVSNLGRLDSISSTMVRDVIEAQDMQRACDLLGCGYLIRLPLDQNSSKILPNLDEIYTVEYIDRANNHTIDRYKRKLRDIIIESQDLHKKDVKYIKISQ